MRLRSKLLRSGPSCFGQGYPEVASQGFLRSALPLLSPQKIDESAPGRSLAWTESRPPAESALQPSASHALSYLSDCMALFPAPGDPPSASLCWVCSGAAG